MKPVLYAEDNPDDVFFMQHVWGLANIPNPLLCVKNGHEAIDYLAGHGAFADRAIHPLPCLLLLDLKMPSKDGFEVLAWVRQQPELRFLKVVIFSSSSLPRDIDKAQALGSDDYVVKSSLPRELLEMIQTKRKSWLPESDQQ